MLLGAAPSPHSHPTLPRPPTPPAEFYLVKKYCNDLYNWRKSEKKPNCLGYKYNSMEKQEHSEQLPT